MPWPDWIRTVEVEPSLYAADYSRLGEQVEILVRAGARIFHFDVGDGHFIAPITAGPIVLKWIAPSVHADEGVLDCHLMVERPERHFGAFKEAGADSVTVHYEACEDASAVVEQARELGLQIGLAINPSTHVEHAAAVAEHFDVVNCMSVFPGYSGQEFIPESLDRIRWLRSALAPQVPIQVDGGIGPDNIGAVYEAGATLFVAASSIFEREDLPRAYRRLVQALA
jgi:ribulose-phosphate 3-epimerase